MALTNFKVCLVVRWGDFENARAKAEFHMLVPNDRNETLFAGTFGRQGAQGMQPDELAVARILGIYREGRVARNRFGPSRGDAQKRAGPFRNFHTEMVQHPRLRLHDDLFVGERSA